MKKCLIAAVLLVCCHMTSAQQAWNAKQQQVIAAMESLSKANTLGSQDIQRYASMLDDRFSRWTIGSRVVNDKAGWVQGIQTWIDRGWAMAASTQQIIEIQLLGDTAITRRIVSEAYIGPDKASMITTSALAEVWIKQQDQWRLVSMTVHPLPNPKS